MSSRSSSTSSLKETIDAYRTWLLDQFPPFLSTFRFKVILTSILVSLVLFTISIAIVMYGSDTNGTGRNSRSNFLDNFGGDYTTIRSTRSGDNSKTTISTQSSTTIPSTTTTNDSLPWSPRYEDDWIDLENLSSDTTAQVVCIFAIARNFFIANPDWCNVQHARKWLTKFPSILRAKMENLLKNCPAFLTTTTTTTTRMPMKTTVKQNREFTNKDLREQLRSWCHRICATSPEKGGKACNCDSAPVMVN